MNNFTDQVKGKKVLIFGLGRQGGGQGDADWLQAQGAEVRLSDQDLTLVQRGQPREDLAWSDLVIKNPGVPDDHPHLRYARELGKPVFTSIAIYVKYASIPVLGVTGTRGKSTTTALITTLLERVYPGQILTGGNIPGTSGLSLFTSEQGKKYAVLELSSFQLHNFHELKCSPPLAVVTNLYPDHLNRYPDMTAYRRDKEAILLYQSPSDVALVNADNPGAVLIGQSAPGRLETFTASDVSSWSTPLPGLHNRENLAAMFAVAKILKIPESVCREVAAQFRGLPFRQEIVRVNRGVTYINDTTATTPTAAIKALEAQTKPTILICGGASKNLPDSALVESIVSASAVKHIVILGSREIPLFVTALKERAGAKIIGQVMGMGEAVKLAAAHAQPDWTVLLSPGFASFDLFANEFDRGRQFNDAVRAL